MDIFFLLFTNLLPLYVLIFIGWVAGRYFEVDRQTLANFAIYICVPVVIFGFVLDLDLEVQWVWLPVIVFFLHSSIAFGALALGKCVFKDARANLAAMCSAHSNTGYFGLPLAILIFHNNPQWVGVYMFMLLGGVIFESTVSYYIASRGQFTVEQSLKRLLKFPTLYAMTAGLLCNHFQVEMPEMFYTYWAYFKGAYVLVGMMVIGAALSKLTKLVIAPRFLAFTFIGKFIVWPLLAWILILVDQNYLHLYSREVHQLLFIMAIVPQGANIAGFATQMNLKPEKAASTILLGTVFALFYIPMMLALSGLFQ